MGNDLVALLCLDHAFSSPLKLRGLPLAEVQASLSLYLEYVRLLNKFRRDESLAEGSNRQRLFGFQVLGRNSYLVPERTLLHERLANQSSSNRRSAVGYRFDYNELSGGITRLISSRTFDRTKVQNGTCYDVHGFSPCLRLLFQKRCEPPKGQGPCPFQHIQPGELTVDWYHTRLRLILLQFQILNSARYDDSDAKKYVLAHSTRNACRDSSNVKLLAWEIALSPPSAFSEARVACKS